MAYSRHFAALVANSQRKHWLLRPNRGKIERFSEIASEITGYFVAINHF